MAKSGKMGLMKIKRWMVIVILAVFLLIIGFFLSVYFGYLDLAWFGFDRKIQSPAGQAEPEEEEKIEAKEWEDPAGFTFSYNKLMEINDNPEDEINYANLQLQMTDRSGEITITVNDTDYADINEWPESDEAVAGGSVLDTKVAGLSAKKISLPGNQRVITGFIDADKVLYLIGLDLGKDSSFWQKNYDLVLSSFEMIPLEGEAEDSLRLIETDMGGRDDSFGGEVIYEAEEIIE